MKSTKPKRAVVPFTWRSDAADHKVLTDYCYNSRISLQQFVDCAVANDARRVGLNLPSRQPPLMMHNPSHPGQVLRTGCITPSGLTVTEAAKRLGIDRKELAEVINGRIAVSLDMAKRFEKAGWGNAAHWLRMQAQYDEWKARKA